MSRAIEISIPAAADLRGIAAYTERNFGPQKKKRYPALLQGALHRIRRDPALGRPYEHPRRRLFRVHVGRHVIYYWFDDAQINVVRILHDAMDAPSRLDAEDG